jgi:hypothetical protein
MAVLTALKTIGVVSLASYGLAKIAHATRWLNWHRLHVVALARANLPAMPRGYTMRALTPSEFAKLDMDTAAAIQADWLGQGYDCLGVVTPNGAVAAVVWMGTRQAREGNIALDFVLPEQVAWDTGMWVHPDYRAGRAFAALWAGGGEWMDQRGLHYSYSVIADYNIASLMAHHRLGTTLLANLLVIRIGSWQWIARGRDRWRMADSQHPLAWRLPLATVEPQATLLRGIALPGIAKFSVGRADKRLQP